MKRPILRLFCPPNANPAVIHVFWLNQIIAGNWLPLFLRYWNNRGIHHFQKSPRFLYFHRIPAEQRGRFFPSFGLKLLPPVHKKSLFSAFKSYHFSIFWNHKNRPIFVHLGIVFRQADTIRLIPVNQNNARRARSLNQPAIRLSIWMCRKRHYFSLT